jgi:2-amino-4-hydroxy-6-hydroxymethyldihydropteridine diphosphokinase
MTKTAYIGVGSNLGDKINNCQEAAVRIDEISGCSVTARSGFYRTQPVGVKGQDWYVNGVVVLSADMPVQDLLKNLLTIETAMGRKRKEKWDSRIIDLDILLFGGEVISEKGLQIPHPLMHLRRFVLVPMVSLAPDLIHPVLRKSMTELLVDCPKEDQSVIPMGIV